MVHLLRNVNTGETYALGDNSTYTLGVSRRNHILLRYNFVCRKHATVIIKNGHIYIKDLNSRYGTWVNDQKIQSECQLHDHDLIYFGKKTCSFILFENPFEVILNSADDTMQILKQLDISVANSYRKSITHYVTRSVSLDSLKETQLLKYLIEKVDVVVPQYFHYMSTCVKQGLLTPNMYRYMPEIDDYLKSKGLEDISPRENRTILFEDTLFIFFEENYPEQLFELITMCGGQSIVNPGTDFTENLRPDFNYVIVNSDKDKTDFLRNLRSKDIYSIDVDDIYISMLKVEFVGLEKVTRQNIASGSDSESIICNSETENGKSLVPKWLRRRKTAKKRLGRNGDITNNDTNPRRSSSSNDFIQLAPNRHNNHTKEHRSNDSRKNPCYSRVVPLSANISKRSPEKSSSKMHNSPRVMLNPFAFEASLKKKMKKSPSVIEKWKKKYPGVDINPVLR